MQLEVLALQDPTGEQIIFGSDWPLLFARQLADADEALDAGPTHPATIHTYKTRPFPVNSPPWPTCGHSFWQHQTDSFL